MTREEFTILCLPEVQHAVAGNRGRDASSVALDRRIPHAREVASQVKYLARAADKLPSYAAAGCILPPRAFEQSSGELCAARKHGSGDSVLDLTCGLGVDAMFLSRRFARVTALERDEVLADVARENFRRLGIANIEVVCAPAEDYIAESLGLGRRFDMIYADPDRRDDKGRKMVCLEDCSPDIASLLPSLRRLAPALGLKLSPMFDVDEAFRIFGGVTVEVVSAGGECKEVLVCDDGRGEDGCGRISAVALHPDGTSSEVSFTRSITDGDAPDTLCTAPFDPSRVRALGIPDAALRKARLVSRALAGRADVWSENGFAFSSEADPSDAAAGLCRWYSVESIEPYSPRRLRRELKGCGVELFKRDFPLTPAEVRRACGLREGRDLLAAVTRIGDEYLFIRLGAQL